jgi:hypothetical protein
MADYKKTNGKKALYSEYNEESEPYIHSTRTHTKVATPIVPVYIQYKKENFSFTKGWVRNIKGTPVHFSFHTQYKKRAHNITTCMYMIVGIPYTVQAPPLVQVALKKYIHLLTPEHTLLQQHYNVHKKNQ